MELIKPELGLIFWTALVFLSVLFLLARFAWKPILKALENRERFISDALSSAEKARQEMSRLQSDHEKILNEAKEERSRMLGEAKRLKDQIIQEAKDKARQEAEKIVANAKIEIENEKMAALVDVKNQVAQLAIDVAGKILRKKLEGQKEQEAYIENLLEDIKTN